MLNFYHRGHEREELNILGGSRGGVRRGSTKKKSHYLHHSKRENFAYDAPHGLAYQKKKTKGEKFSSTWRN